jgi:hypothetical protein
LAGGIGGIGAAVGYLIDAPEAQGGPQLRRAIFGSYPSLGDRVV